MTVQLRTTGSSDDYVLLEYSRAALGEIAKLNGIRLFTTCRTAATSVSPPIEVRDPLRVIQPGDDIEQTIRSLITGALGAIVLLGPESMIAVDLGMMVARATPLLVLKSKSQSPSDLLLTSPAAVTCLDFDPDPASDRHWSRLQSEVEQWLVGVPRRDSIATLSTAERRAIEVFVMAFYRALDAHNTGLNGPDLLTAQVHVETINLQMRAPEPNRSILIETTKALGSYFMGIATGVGASYLYDLLPHLH